METNYSKTTKDDLNLLINGFVKTIIKKNPLLQGSRRSFTEHDLFLDDELRMIYMLTEELSKHIHILEEQFKEDV